MVRETIVMIGLMASLPAIAGEMTASEARAFVIGQQFTYTCVDRSRGSARGDPDGAVGGAIQFQGAGPFRYAAMPAGTLRVEGERICASLRGSLMRPCFYLERTDADSFRGSILGFGLAYCDFTRLQGHAHEVREDR